MFSIQPRITCPVRSVHWSCQALTPMWLSQLYSSNCSYDKHAILFILKELEGDGWGSVVLRVNRIEGQSRLWVSWVTSNYIWLWGSSPKAWEICCTLSLPLLPGSLWTGVVVPVKVQSMGQIELFNHLLRIIIRGNYTAVWKLFLLDRNTW